MSLRLAELQDGPSQWPDIADAARILWLASISPDIIAFRHELPTYYPNTSYSATELWTGLNASRRAVFVAIDENITIAFEGSDRNELVKNTWANAKGPNWWDIPYAVYDGGNRVHSFFRDMWYGMRDETFRALSEAIRNIKEKGSTPRKITIAGFSQGGGVSTMAFTDILEHIRCTYGSESAPSQAWAEDNNIGNLVQHLTFAAMAAGDQGFHTVLNNLYERHAIRAWDFMHYQDWTRHAHDLAFRSWRGHRYILPDAVVRHHQAEFGQHGHSILGYLGVAEWMAMNGTDQVKSEYAY
ncbi:unnamed protein product [Alternaria burnsii]|nr:unnamed protein product [Alternaria burnsii]